MSNGGSGAVSARWGYYKAVVYGAIVGAWCALPAWWPGYGWEYSVLTAALTAPVAAAVIVYAPRLQDWIAARFRAI